MPGLTESWTDTILVIEVFSCSIKCTIKHFQKIQNSIFIFNSKKNFTDDWQLETVIVLYEEYVNVL